ncbi:MAG: OB-fold nucleic acid binding domain-containing protein [Candidatus Hadarchaeales archaeon]
MKPTAYRLRIGELVAGKYVRSTEVSEPSHLVTKSGLKLARARIIGTVIEKFLRDDRGYIMLRLDDGSETITLRAWRDGVQELERYKTGDVLDVIGKVREFEGEIYLVPEMIFEVRDPNFELMREVENVRNTLRLHAEIGGGATGGEVKVPLIVEAEEHEESSLPQVPDETKNKVLLALDRLDSKTGVSVREICEEIHLPPGEVEDAVRVLLAEGNVFEPEAGRYRITR